MPMKATNTKRGARKRKKRKRRTKRPKSCPEENERQTEHERKIQHEVAPMSTSQQRQNACASEQHGAVQEENCNSNWIDGVFDAA